jgi:hypothetical protein
MFCPFAFIVIVIPATSLTQVSQHVPIKHLGSSLQRQLLSRLLLDLRDRWFCLIAVAGNRWIGFATRAPSCLVVITRIPFSLGVQSTHGVLAIPVISAAEVVNGVQTHVSLM